MLFQKYVLSYVNSQTANSKMTHMSMYVLLLLCAHTQGHHSMYGAPSILPQHGTSYKATSFSLAKLTNIALSKHETKYDSK